MRRLLVRLPAGEDGYSLIEMLMVIVLMGIVISGLTTAFVSGTGAENNLNQVFQAEQTARLGVERLRADVHCASAAMYSSSINGFPGVMLAVGSCSPSTPTVTWCVLPSTLLTGHYALWRTTIDTSSTCTASDTSKVLEADDLLPVGSPASTANILTTPTIAYQGLETVGIDVKVSVNAGSTSKNTYELTDSLVTRNYTRCTTAGGCSAPTVS